MQSSPVLPYPLWLSVIEVTRGKSLRRQLISQHEESEDAWLIRVCKQKEERGWSLIHA